MAKQNQTPFTLLIAASKPNGPTVRAVDGVPSTEPNGWDTQLLKAGLVNATLALRDRLEALKGRPLNLLVGGNAGPELAWAAAALKLKAEGLPVTVTVVLPFRTKTVTRQGRSESKSWDAYWDDATRKWFAAVLAGSAVNALTEHAVDSKAGDAAVEARNAMLAQLADAAVIVAKPGDTATRAIAGEVALQGRLVYNAWEAHTAFYPEREAKAAAPAVDTANPWD